MLDRLNRVLNKSTPHERVRSGGIRSGISLAHTALCPFRRVQIMSVKGVDSNSRPDRVRSVLLRILIIHATNQSKHIESEGKNVSVDLLVTSYQDVTHRMNFTARQIFVV